MLYNFFKSSFRNLVKTKGYSLLNIFGLAVGITCAGLIFLWVEDELNYNQFNEKKDLLYFIRENQKYDTYTATFGSTPGPLAPAMQAEIPGIARTCRLHDNETKLMTVGDKPVFANGSFAEASLFNMFTMPFTEGNAADAFKDRYSLVITEKTAKKFFGVEKGVVGKTVRMDNKQDYVVTGVIKDIPENSDVRFEWVAPCDIWFDESPFAKYWGSNCLTTFVELKPGVKAASVNKKLYDFIQQREPRSIARPFLWTMNDWHLRNEFDNGVQTGGGKITYVRLFATIAWIILLIACINFMNLSTARSEKRAKEVGVRKVLGSGKSSLVLQFISEAFILAFLSALIAVALMVVLLPAFNLLVQKNLVIGFDKPMHWLVLIGITVICGLLAGSYPSFYLSSFNPVFVLKGVKMKNGSAAMIRKGLVIAQFSVSIILIISTLIIYQQIQHVKDRSLGFNKNNLLQTDVVGDVAQYYPSIKQDLLNTGSIESVALSDYNTLYGGNNTGGLTWAGKSTKAQILVSGRYVTPEYMSTVQMKLVDGRDFVQTDSITSKNMNVLITQSLASLMGSGSAIGKVLWNEGDSSPVKMNVVGVINDYVYGDMYGKPDPVVFMCVPPSQTNLMYLRLKKDAKPEVALSQVEAVLKKGNPAYPFNYQFTDDQFNTMFSGEMLVSQLSKIFAGLAILISCIGLFGLAAYTAERRTKEIGVRKVLGASVGSITSLLSKDFIKLVVFACLISFPLAWWAMNNWLENYKYRIHISWWIFAAAGLSAICIALLTISFQSIKAALANPVKSLRSE